MVTGGGTPEVQEEMTPLEEKVLSVLPDELVAGVEGHHSAAYEDQEDSQANAANWSIPLVKCNDHILYDFNRFKEVLRKLFAKHLFVQASDNQLLNLRQGNKDLLFPITFFNQLVAETEWPEEKRTSLFYRGLRDDLKDVLAQIVEPLTECSKFIDLVVRLGHRLSEPYQTVGVIPTLEEVVIRPKSDDCIMESLNSSIFYHSTFVLSGLEENDPTAICISIFICSLYSVMTLGNISILYIIKTEQSLHAPMYYFLSVLAVTDLALSMTTLPTIFSIFLLRAREIHIDACLCQVYFLNVFTIVESGVLLAMSADRFIAIWNPLRYTSILSKSMALRIGLFIALRAIVLILPEPLLDKRLPFCRNNVLTHPWCLHQDIIKLACADVKVHSYYGLFVVSLMISDAIMVVLSYMIILRVVLQIASQSERSRTLNTCMSHIVSVFLFYMPRIFLSVLHRFSNVVPPLMYKVLAFIFYLLPPLMNPIIYCIKNKQIHTKYVQYFSKMKV
ncbi:olfactory receptor 51A4-like [Pleurodeles waltl]|uniref:olfactory receptor 51A4-like n=1 Tax=Pleurodeles waltl TaxID=8319 RepID=UPI0037094B42